MDDMKDKINIDMVNFGEAIPQSNILTNDTKSRVLIILDKAWVEMRTSKYLERTAKSLHTIYQMEMWWEEADPKNEVMFSNLKMIEQELRKRLYVLSYRRVFSSNFYKEYNTYREDKVIVNRNTNSRPGRSISI